MSTDIEKPKTNNTWIIALLVSIALNGVLVGLLLSKQVKPNIGTPKVLPVQNTMRVMPNNPRHIVRTLSPERRKQVMATALKSLKSQDAGHTRRVFKQLRQAKLKTMDLMSADVLDTVAIEQSLADIRELNQKLAVSGDALMIEILAQLTPEERKTAREALRDRTSKKRRRKMERH